MSDFDRAVLASNEELRAAWRAVLEQPALQPAVLKQHLEDVAEGSVERVRHDLTAHVARVVSENPGLAIGCGVAIGLMIGWRR
jgi:ElaB/YqjD/DUF883 family membrane-anchored ribosome-binding protein